MTYSRDTKILLGMSLVAVLFISTGLFLGGSPWEARAAKRDTQQVQALITAQDRVIGYYHSTQTLPTSTQYDALMRSQRSSEVSPLPAYTPLDATSYQLCATFERSLLSTTALMEGMRPFSATDRSLANKGTSYVNFYEHPAGQACWKILNLRTETYGGVIFDVEPQFPL